MRTLLSALAALVLAASPSLAGGDWDDYDGRDYGGYGYYDGYYDGPAYAYYPAPRAYYAPRGYYVPDAYYYGYGGDCEVKRKWRHGYYSEKLDCDD